MSIWAYLVEGFPAKPTHNQTIELKEVKKIYDGNPYANPTPTLLPNPVTFVTLILNTTLRANTFPTLTALIQTFNTLTLAVIQC